MIIDESFVDQVIYNRHSTRSFKNDMIPSTDLKAILMAGRYAPSAKNRQPWRFSIVCSQSVRDRISRVMLDEVDRLRSDHGDPYSSIKAKSLECSALCVSHAPVLIVVHYVVDRTWTQGNENNWVMSVDDLEAVDFLGIGACIENMALAAEARGINSLWNCDVLYAAEKITSILSESMYSENETLCHENASTMSTFGYPIVAALLLGYEERLVSLPADSITVGRIDLDELCRWV